MTRKRLSLPSLCTVFAFILACTIQTAAQSPNLASRITQPIDESNLVVLRGNTSPLARPEFDQGAAPASQPMQRMLLVLQRSPQQEAALDQLLEQQQDNSSPNYHRWLTPQQFGADFGPAAADVQTITSWLQSHGFQVTRVSNGGIVIEFSGTASQVQGAFHTAIHKYTVNAEQHYANSTDPQIPAALVPVVAGVRSLNNFPARPMNHPAGVFRRDKDSGKILPVGPLPIPQFNAGTGCGILGGPCEFLGPFDLATIYNVLPLWNSATPIDGTGQTIAIVGETDIIPADWTAFWNMFGVTTPKGTLNIIHDGPDPGIQGDEPEADIDTQWSSAVAKGATIDFVISQTTEVTLGVDLSAEYIVDNNLAPVMSESYGICELFIGTTGNTYYNLLWQQASAQGITVFISAGDSGSAVCDDGNLEAQFGLTVSGFASTPFNISVGGTDFNDLTTTATFWNATNNANQANAKGYIPEMTWNDTCTNSEIFPFTHTTTAEQTCDNAQVQQDGFLGVVGGSGGASNCTSSNGNTQASCTGGNAKPSWQAGPGVPSDGKRDVPDVSLFASNGFNGTGYIVCESDQLTGPCSLTNGQFLGFGGTSVSSPAFAGIMALINQKTGERQGNANFVFYKMAAAAGNSCDSATVPSTGPNNCIFYDIPTGSTIAMACAKGSPNCTTSTSGDQIGVLSGFNTGTGYDQAIGLGSVNVDNLVNQWSTFAGQFKATKFSAFSIGPPITITHGQAIPVAATVVPQTGTGTPTGSVVLIANEGSSSTSPSDQQAAQQILTLANGSLPAAAATIFLPGGTSYTVTARYEGDSTFAPSTSSPVTVTVNPEPSKTQAAIQTFSPTTGIQTSSNATNFPLGSLILLRANVTNSSAGLCAPNGNQVYGCPTGTVTLKDTYNGATNPLDAGTYSLNAEGYAEDQVIFLLGGQHSIVSTYSGDASYNASTSSPDVVTVTKAPTTISLTVVNPTVQAGAGANFTAVVSTQTFLPATTTPAEFPSNNVQFFLGTKPITVPSPGNTVLYTDGTSPTTGFAQLAALLDTTSLPLGNNTITAQFTGDSSYSASAVSNSVVVDNQSATNLVLSSSNSAISHGASVTFTAVITPSQTGGPALTGTVQFSDGSPLGSPVSVANGQAQLSTSTLPAGTLSITATYSGDTNYAISAGTTAEVVTGAPTFTTTPLQATVTVSSPGGSGQAIITFAAGAGFTGTIPLSSGLCSGMPLETTCSWSASSVVLSSTANSAMATVTFQTTAPSKSIAVPQSSNRPAAFGKRTLVGSFTLACILCMGVLFACFAPRQRRWSTILALLALASAVAIGSCGGGSSSGGGGGGGGGNAGTPVGNSNVVLTFNGAGVTPAPTTTVVLSVQ
jgi:subtilase family serine protease